jgi:hypothetical protein
MEKQLQVMPYAIHLYQEMKFHNPDTIFQNSYTLAGDLSDSAQLLNSFEKESLDLKQMPENEIELERMAEGIIICWQEGAEKWG